MKNKKIEKVNLRGAKREKEERKKRLEMRKAYLGVKQMAQCEELDLEPLSQPVLNQIISLLESGNRSVTSSHHVTT